MTKKKVPEDDKEERSPNMTKKKMSPNMTKMNSRMTILHLSFPWGSRFLLSLNRSPAGLHRSRLTALPELLPTLRQV